MKRIFLTLLFLSMASFAYAQDGGDAASFDWRELAAVAVNSVAVMAIVQLLKMLLPNIPGGVKQILALVMGPLLMWGATALGGLLGYPIDFSPIAAVFAGPAAMGLFDVAKKVGKVGG